MADVTRRISIDAEELAGRTFPYQHDPSLVEDIDLLAATPGKDLNWLETAGRTDDPREPAVKINNIFAMKTAVMRGMGIAMLPNYMVEADSGLVQLLPEEPAPSFASYFVYPAELKNSARVHVFRDFLLAKAQSWSF